MEGDRRAMRDAADDMRRLSIDRSLLAALLDRCRPETHTFHLPVGEMTPTLQDVSFLMGLPCAGTAVAAMDSEEGWREDLLERFAPVQRNNLVPPYRSFPTSEKHGPTKT